MAQNAQRIQSQPDHGNDAQRARPLILHHGGPESIAVAPTPFLGRAYADPSTRAEALTKAGPATRARMVSDLQRSHGNLHVQRVISSRRPAPPAQVRIQRCGGTPCGCSADEQMAHAQEDGGEAVQRLATTDVAGEIKRRSGGGASLHPIARSKLEPAMGHDLGHIAVHADSTADRLSRAVDAEAFTTGNDIFFREGRYDPHSTSGLRLIAHEATHTIQQGRGRVAGVQGFGGLHINEPGDAFEQEAEQTADSAMARLDSPAGATGDARASTRASDLGIARGLHVARLHSSSGAGLTIQRSPLAPKKSGPLSVIFDPSAAIQDSASNTKTVEFSDGQLRKSLQITPGTTGFIVVPVKMTWTRTSGGQPGPGPTPKPPVDISTACKIALALSAPLPGVNQVVTLICKSQDPGAIIDSINDAQLCALAALLGLGLGGIACGVLVLAGAGQIVRDALKDFFGIPKKGGGGGTTPPVQPTVDNGKGDARVEVNYIHGADGKLKLFPTPARVDSEGIGAEVVNPVGVTVNEMPTGGLIAIAPAVRGSAQITRPNGETLSQVNVVNTLVELDVTLPPPPAPVPFCFGLRLNPFITGKDRFEDEEGQQRKLLEWFRNMDKRVRTRVFAGTTPVIVAGRASRVGDPKFNMDLAEKRAKRVGQLMSNFGGEFAGINKFAFGELTATGGEKDNSAEQRRADLRVSGELTGADTAGGAIFFPADHDERVCQDTDLPPKGLGGGGGSPAAVSEGGGGAPAVTSGGAPAEGAVAGPVQAPPLEPGEPTAGLALEQGVGAAAPAADQFGLAEPVGLGAGAGSGAEPIGLSAGLDQGSEPGAEVPALGSGLEEEQGGSSLGVLQDVGEMMGLSEDEE